MTVMRVAAERRVRVASTDADDRAVRGELARRELVRLEHRHHRLDARERAERNLLRAAPRRRCSR